MSAIVFLFVAAAAGWLAGRRLERGLPFARAACALAALVVSVLLALPLGDLPPHILTVSLPPAILGALAGAFACRFALRRLTATSFG